MAKYDYDYSGRRIKKTVYGSPDVITKYCYDGSQIIAEYDGSNNLLRKYIYGDKTDEPICMIDVAGGNAKYYYHFDGLGSVVALSNSAGTVVENYRYDVFGVPNITSSFGNRFMFTGREYDSDTNLYCYRARFYKPSIGRFMSRDPLGYVDSKNLYQYCLNNPINYTDPFGLNIWKKIKDWIKDWDKYSSRDEIRDEIKRIYKGERTPSEGEPGSRTKFVKDDGGETIREYDSDGRAKRDID